MTSRTVQVVDRYVVLGKSFVVVVVCVCVVKMKEERRVWVTVHPKFDTHQPVSAINRYINCVRVCVCVCDRLTWSKCRRERDVHRRRQMLHSQTASELRMRYEYVDELGFV